MVENGLRVPFECKLQCHRFVLTLHPVVLLTKFALVVVFLLLYLLNVLLISIIVLLLLRRALNHLIAAGGIVILVHVLILLRFVLVQLNYYFVFTLGH